MGLLRKGQLATLLTVMAVAGSACDSGDDAREEPIKIGIIAEISGPLELYGTSIGNSALLAVSEINEAGGIDGREVVAIVEDTESDLAITAEKAKKLVDEDGVDVVIGPAGSDANDTVFRVVVAERGALQLYPTIYEGGKCNATFFSFGAVPAQQIRPLIRLLHDRYGSFGMLFGADYVWPQRTFEIARPIIEGHRGIVVSELLLPLVTDDFTRLVEEVRNNEPDYIVSLYPAVWEQALQALEDAGLLAGVGMGTIFVGDQDVALLGTLADGHYSALPLFTVSEGPGMESYLAAYAAAFDGSAPQGVTALGAYTAVHMYKEAVEAAGSTDAGKVADAMVGLSVEGPTGRVTMTPSHHLEQPISIAQSQGGSNTLVETIPSANPEEACTP